jgi:hypothetical protein
MRKALLIGAVVLTAGAVAFELMWWRPSPFRRVTGINHALLWEQSGSGTVRADTLHASPELDSLLALLRAGSWEKSWHTLPGGIYAVKLLQDTTLVATIRVCSDCLVGGVVKPEGDWALLRGLSVAERAAIDRWFGIR